MTRYLWLAALLLASLPAAAQQLDFSQGGPIAITAANGIEWRQVQQEVIARGNAKAVRGEVTVNADQLIAWYRKKAGGNPATAKAPAAQGLTGDTDTAGNEIFRVQAEGNVHIYTQTDQAWCDRATYDMDQAVLVMTGRNLKLTTPNEVLTSRDDMEYWAQKHMAVARGNAVVRTKDARQLSADTLVAYTAGAGQSTGTPAAAQRGASSDPAAASGKLERVEAFGHVTVRTPTDLVTGDRAVYVPDSGIARIGGNVRITRGQNQLNGAEAEVNMKTGISRLISSNSGRVQGLVVPNDKTNPSLSSSDNSILGGANGGQPAGGRK